MVNTIGTQTTYLGPNGAQSSGKTDPAAARPDARTGQNRAQDGDSVTLSAAARAVLNGASARVDALLQDKGEAIFRKGLEPARAYRENLALKLEDPSLDADTAIQTRSDMLAREKAAFTAPEHTGDVLSRARAYIEFYDSLSPEEQQSERYSGTRETMVAIVEQEVAARGLEMPDFNQSQSPFDLLLKALEEARFAPGNETERQAVLDQFRTQSEALVGSEPGKEERRNLETRLTALQDLIERSRKGDDAAFSQLEALADEERSVSGAELG